MNMNRCGGIFVAVLFLAIGAGAQAPREDGWVPLFNGKDLAGWKKNGDEKWIVDQGTILCESTANKYGYLTTENTYRDFTLRLKFKGDQPRNLRRFAVRDRNPGQAEGGARAPVQKSLERGR